MRALLTALLLSVVAATADDAVHAALRAGSMDEVPTYAGYVSYAPFSATVPAEFVDHVYTIEVVEALSRAR